MAEPCSSRSSRPLDAAPPARVRQGARQRGRSGGGGRGGLAALVGTVLALVASIVIPVGVAQGAPGGPVLAIERRAHCRGAVCSVLVTLDGVPEAGVAVVQVGGERRRIRVHAGDQRRVVEVPASALPGRVRVSVAGETTRRRVRPRALPVNTVGDRCATLAATGAVLSEGPASELDAASSLPATGTLRAAVLAVDFPRDAGSGDPRATTGWIGAGAAVLASSSYGRLAVEVVAETSSWLRMPQRFARYGFGDGTSYDEHARYVQDAIDAADAEIDFAGVDVILVVVPEGVGIPGAQTFRGLPGSLSTGEGPRHAAVTFGSDAATLGAMVVAHEMGHVLGLPDLYAYDGAPLHRFVGIWDWMGSIFAPTTDLFAWHRAALGWIDATQLVCAPRRGPTWARLAPVATASGTKALFVRTGPTTALVVEYRARRGGDAAICRPGALVYEIDAAVDSGYGPVRVIGGDADGVGCGAGPRSDATLRVGRSRTIDGITVTVVGRSQGRIEVLVER